MAKITVLGSGLIGNVIAQDLSERHQVMVADINEKSLKRLSHKKNIETRCINVSDKNQLHSVIQMADIVVTALPGHMAFNVLKNIIEAGKNIADISFYPENALKLHDFAKSKNCTVIVDCGVAPGMSNFLAGYHYTKMQVDEFICYVGGLPFERKFPYQYKAPFSPADVIEEYIRPARLKVNGNIIEKPALSDIEMLDFEGIGTLEAFNTDGLRSLLFTLDIPNMKEKTMRYPGHAELILALKASGFFNQNEIEINQLKIKPIDITTHLLKEIWKLNERDDEFTVMRNIIKGYEQNQSVTYIYDVLDKKDQHTGFSSMARTTGFTCNAMVELILQNKFNDKGIFPPEMVATNDDIFNFVMSYLRERNIHYTCKKETHQS